MTELSFHGINAFPARRATEEIRIRTSLALRDGAKDCDQAEHEQNPVRQMHR
ncbi:hypothetical protein [Methylocella tundrae]|uniref:hypothetical protein n=1 Tax=Methylocella tundrae TaxID=227605 RepID=UPI00157AD055